IGFFLYIVFAAHYGTAAVAAYFIGVRILALSFLPGFGFAAAAATMIGQSLGAGSPQQAERSGREAVRLAVRLMTACGIVIFLAARPIARLFVDDEAVVTDAVSFIRVLAACQPLMATDFTLGGALRERRGGVREQPLRAVRQPVEPRDDVEVGCGERRVDVPLAGGRPDQGVDQDERPGRFQEGIGEARNRTEAIPLSHRGRAGW